jgi:hypothetical protein
MPETGRRTVIIRGQVADPKQPRRSDSPTRGSGSQRTRPSGSTRARTSAPARPRPRPRSYERHRSHPDRVAMWAVVLGVLLVLVAATSSHAAVLHHPAPTHAAPTALTAPPALTARRSR